MPDEMRTELLSLGRGQNPAGMPEGGQEGLGEARDLGLIFW